MRSRSATLEALPDGGVDVALRDGSSVQVRCVRAEDRPAMQAFLRGLSPDSIGFRFFGQVSIGWATDWSTEVDDRDRHALVATAGPEQAIVAHALYVRTAPERAEVAFTVADAWQGRGIATILLAHLAGAAEQHGIAVFTAQVLPGNHRMIDVFRDSGFPVAMRSGEGVIEVELPTSRTEATQERFHGREQTAAIAAVRRFLRPRTIALIGASRMRGSVGGELLHNLCESGYPGAVYAVNRRAGGRIQGVPAYRSIAQVPERVELAVLAVPAEQVTGVARECEAAGVGALLVISAGFAELGEEGAARQRELLSICRESGMRLIGPNCLGVLSTVPEAPLNATFLSRTPPSGPIGFLTQSGGVGMAIVEAAGRLGLGLSSFVSVGNKADISGNDLLQYWEQDPATQVLLLYLESFGNPRRFARLARRIGRSKPIVAVKSGRSPAGARASASHTGALLASSDVTVDALFRQAGVIRTDTMHELFDVGALLSNQPVPAGARVAIVTNVGGPGILCADACAAAGLDVVELSAGLRGRLSAFLAPQAALANPIDMIATASPQDYRRTLDELIASGECDAVITIFVPPLQTSAREVAREVRAAARRAKGVTLAAVYMNSEGAPRSRAGSGRVPSFEYPEDAARALGHAARYARWRKQPLGRVPELAGCRRAEAAAIVSGALAAGDGWLAAEQASALLECYGLPVVASQVVSGPEEAAVAAAELGFPVALKGLAGGLLHKSDAGAVRLALQGEDAVGAAAREIVEAVSAAGHEPRGLLVQRMAPAGVELLMGVVHDASFGPVIACGAGGTSAELLRDVAVRITPLTDLDASEMLRSLRTFPLLEGYRGTPPTDLAAVEQALLRLSALVEAHPEVAELDANPLIAGPHGAVIVDARILLAPAAPRRPLPSL